MSEQSISGFIFLFVYISCVYFFLTWSGLSSPCGIFVDGDSQTCQNQKQEEERETFIKQRLGEKRGPHNHLLWASDGKPLRASSGNRKPRCPRHRFAITVGLLHPVVMWRTISTSGVLPTTSLRLSLHLIAGITKSTVCLTHGVGGVADVLGCLVKTAQVKN